MYLRSSYLQYGWTPLYVAALYGFDQVVEILVTAGADVNFVNKVSYLQCSEAKLTLRV